MENKSGVSGKTSGGVNSADTSSAGASGSLLNNIYFSAGNTS